MGRGVTGGGIQHSCPPFFFRMRGSRAYLLITFSQREFSGDDERRGEEDAEDRGYQRTTELIRANPGECSSLITRRELE